MSESQSPSEPTPIVAQELPRPITLLINVNSRQGKMMFQDAVKAIEDAGVPLAQAVALQSKEEMQRILKREIEAQAKLVIIGGGDGTLSGCAAQLINTPVAMGVLPLGTGNTLARSLGIPLDLKGAAQAIAQGHIEKMDVGCVNGRPFLNSVTLGLSTEMARALDKETKARYGLLAWPKVGIRVLKDHNSMILKVSSHERTYHVRTHQLVISNGRYIAGPIAATPTASVQDARLRVFVLGGSRMGSLLRATFEWISGRMTQSRSSKYFSTQKVRVESLRGRLEADVDGEINEKTPLELEIMPGALRVVVPRGFDAETV